MFIFQVLIKVEYRYWTMYERTHLMHFTLFFILQILSVTDCSSTMTCLNWLKNLMTPSRKSKWIHVFMDLFNSKARLTPFFFKCSLFRPVRLNLAIEVEVQRWKKTPIRLLGLTFLHECCLAIILFSSWHSNFDVMISLNWLTYIDFLTNYQFVSFTNTFAIPILLFSDQKSSPLPTIRATLQKKKKKKKFRETSIPPPIIWKAVKGSSSSSFRWAFEKKVSPFFFRRVCQIKKQWRPKMLS